MAAGLVLTQVLLFGLCLAGKRILLPLDVLTAPSVYLPLGEEIHVENFYLSDLIFLSEPMRMFALEEFKSGRLPMWAPYQYAGAPFLGPKFSPFVLPQYLVKSPAIIAWMHLFAACVAGFGMYSFCRRVAQVDYWPAVLVAWCYPLTGFFIFWQNYYLVWPVYWLPSILLATHHTIRGLSRLAPPGLAILIGITLVSGNPDTAAQVLLTGGLFAVALLVREHFLFRQALTAPTPLSPESTNSPEEPDSATAPKPELKPSRWPIPRAVLRFTAACLLGIALGLPYLLPLLEYSKTGARIQQRGAGVEERPPVGIRALPQVVLPDMYGAQARSKTGFRFASENQLESTATAYAGIVTTLLLVPFAFVTRKDRFLTITIALLALLSLSWSLNVPGLVDLLRLPGFNMMSHNRLVFVACFGLLSLGAIGLDRLGREKFGFRMWMIVPLLVLGAAFGWAAYRSLILPPEVATRLPAMQEQAGRVGWISNPSDVRDVQMAFQDQYIVAAILSFAALVAFIAIAVFRNLRPNLIGPIGALMLVDLLWFAHARNPQADPRLYYPQLPVFKELAALNPGRVLGYMCLPPQLPASQRFNDVRGYDGVDPQEYLELAGLAAGQNSPRLEYAAIQWFTPQMGLSYQGDVLLHPVLDLLGVTHVIYRGEPAPDTKPVLQWQDYWVLRNPRAMPKAFVPRRVQAVAEKAERLRILGETSFNPRDLALLQTPVDLPHECSGNVALVESSPNQLVLNCEMDTPGLVVIGERWDSGWHAEIAGRRTEIFKVNHCLQGVLVPEGPTTVRLKYEPETFRNGLFAAGGSTLLILGWVFVAIRTKNREEPDTQGPE